MYRVGIIGTGRIASTIQDEVEFSPITIMRPYSHAGAYGAHPSTEIVAAADINSERLQEFGARWNVTACYADYRDMLANEQLDIVSVCTPTRFHAEVVHVVATHDIKGIFMEKPLAPTLRETDAMIAAVDGAGIAAVVNHTRTFDPYYQRVRWLIANGAIGTPVDVMVRWREGMSFGGSHLFNLLRYLLAAEVRSVYGRLDAGDGLFDPGGSGVVEFDNGVQAFINNELGHAMAKEVDISGTNGRIRIGDMLPPELYVRNAESAFGEFLQHPFPVRSWRPVP